MYLFKVGRIAFAYIFHFLKLLRMLKIGFLDKGLLHNAHVFYYSHEIMASLVYYYICLLCCHMFVVLCCLV